MNVARVIARFGGSVRAHYVSGGATGSALDSLVDGLGLPVHRTAIMGDTRVSAVVLERSTGQQYRFVRKGRTLSQTEWAACLAALGAAAADLVERKRANMVAVTLGADGALLALPGGTYRLPALAVEALGSVGAGGSFLGAIVFAPSQGRGDIAAFRFGMLAGAATILREGADLCHPDGAKQLLAFVEHPTRKELA